MPHQLHAGRVVGLRTWELGPGRRSLWIDLRSGPGALLRGRAIHRVGRMSTLALAARRSSRGAFGAARQAGPSTEHAIAGSDCVTHRAALAVREQFIATC